jgi:uroporphyrin-III C-methyltransferase
LFVKSVVFAGAGAGSADMCTIAGKKALERCDVCLYDSLMDPSLLDYLPKTSLRIDTGKRCGNHSMLQTAISGLITMYARRGLKVVRLKGGDPGIFGRLVEEIDALDILHLPYKVIPGVSSLNVATTGTGILLTRRGISRGFCAITPRQQNGGIGSIQKDERSKLPIAFFMTVSVTDEVVRQLKTEGMPGNTPVAMVFNAGSDSETIVRGTLDTIGSKIKGGAESCAESNLDMPGILIVGKVTNFEFNNTWGALKGRRILLTCSEDLQEKASDIV